MSPDTFCLCVLTAKWGQLHLPRQVWDVKQTVSKCPGSAYGKYRLLLCLLRGKRKSVPISEKDAELIYQSRKTTCTWRSQPLVNFSLQDQPTFSFLMTKLASCVGGMHPLCLTCSCLTYKQVQL